jgi:uroporphyrinogen-III synthase
MTAAESLAGRGIVVTRPALQAASLAAVIEARGGRAIVFPTIEIRDIDDRRALSDLVDRLESFDIAIFVSPNAVNRGLAAIRERRPLPRKLRIAAVGRGSARALERHGVTGVIAPIAGNDSESLLEMPDLREVEGRRVVVFRGAGGRELMRETLEARGAHVEYAECYRRALPAVDAGELVSAWDSPGIAAFVATSGEGLRNLCALLGTRGHERLSRTPVFVTHSRIADTGRELGLQILVLTGASDEEIGTTLARYFADAAR